jgi:hypothetical protein
LPRLLRLLTRPLRRLLLLRRRLLLLLLRF